MSASNRMPHGGDIEEIVVSAMRDDLARASFRPRRRPLRARRRAGDIPSAHKRPWRLVLIPLAAAALVSLLLVVDATVGHTPDAVALGPRPLQFEPLDRTMAEVVADAMSSLAVDRSGPALPLRESVTSGWYAEINGQAITEGLDAIHPEDRRVEWSEDLSGTVTVTAGVPYRADGAPLPPGSVEPGSMLWEMQYAPGDYTAGGTGTPPTDAQGLETLINSYSSGDQTSGAADHISGFAALMGSWTLPNAHHAAFLDILLTDADAAVVGTTIDRAGRPAIGLRATSASTPWFDLLILLSPDTGRVIATERIYTGTADELPLPAGTITSYTLWETQQ